MQDLFNIKNETYQKDELKTSQTKTDIFSTNIHGQKNSEKKFLCEKCNKFFSTAGNLRNHINSIHYNYRPYKCSFPNCNKAYGVESKLIIHERTHTGFKPFICQICQKSFNEKGNLKAHLKFHSEIRPFKCTLCNKEYKTNKHLKDHIKIEHYKIKKFCCKFCNKNFGRNSNLKAHIKKHTKEKDFECKFEGCGKRFTEKRNMEMHYARHLKKLNKPITNVRIKKINGPKKIEKDFEEKVEAALNQLDNINIEQIKIEEEKENENKTYVSSFEKKENLSQNCCDIIKNNNKNNIDSSNDTNLGNFLNFQNFNPLMIDSKKNSTENLNDLTMKNEEKCLEDENICDDNDFITNNINNSNNFMGNNYNNLDTFIPQNFSYINFIDNDLN